MRNNQDNLKNEIVALVGTPNSGKTTLYNWLTNSKFKTVNYPGATVEYAIGESDSRLGKIFIAMDTPGTYSLFPKSLDEEVTLRALYDHHELGQVSKVILVIDGTQLERQLLLARQLKEANFSLVVAVTMNDLLLKNNIQLNVDFLEKNLDAPVILFDGVSGKGIKDVVDSIHIVKSKKQTKLDRWNDEELLNRLKEIKTLAQSSTGNISKVNAIYDSTQRVDKLLLHPIFGVLIFFTIMSLLFSSIFWLATPFMGYVDSVFSFLIDYIYEVGHGAFWADFLAHGFLASISSVLVFTPQIFILFFGIGIIESTGYLARAATLIDKPFSKLGLSGRSFVPVLSGFACAVPAIMATRNISSKRDRLITNLIIPLMTCSARLPVYALLLSFLFKDQPAWKAGLVMSTIYLGSIILGSLAAMILNRIIARKESSHFTMELPLYRKPKWKNLFWQSVDRTKSYAFRAGPMIFIFAILIWTGTTFPNYNEQSNQIKLETSYLAKIGKKIEPILSPMEVDWRVGVGLLSAFAARETFVSSLAIVFNITEDVKEDSQRESLLKAMKEAKYSNGNKLFTVASVSGIIAFFMLAMQCMATFSISIKENGSRKFAIGQLVGLNIVAYFVAVLVVQFVHLVDKIL